MAGVQGISSYMTYLKWGTSPSSMTKVVDIRDYGDLSGEPNMIDITTLSHRREVQISGILTGDNITFTANYTKENYAACSIDEDKPLFYSVTFQDGSGFTWQGSHRLSVSGKGVDDAVDFVINVAVSTDMEWFEDEEAYQL